MAIHWAVLRFRHYLACLPSFTVLVPGVAEVMWLKSKGLPPRSLDRLLDIQCYPIQFVPSTSSLRLQPHEPLLIGSEAPVDIDRPAEDAVGKFVRKHFTGTPLVVHFDGGASKTGFVVHSVAGDLVYARGEFCPVRFSTNNLAEMAALVAAAEFVVSPEGLALA